MLFFYCLKSILLNIYNANYLVLRFVKCILSDLLTCLNKKGLTEYFVFNVYLIQINILTVLFNHMKIL